MKDGFRKASIWNMPESCFFLACLILPYIALFGRLCPPLVHIDCRRFDDRIIAGLYTLKTKQGQDESINGLEKWVL